MQAMTREQRFLVPPSVRSAVNDDGAVLLDINSGSIYSLNVVGGFIWNRLTLGRSSEEIARALSSECDISDALALADIKHFTAKLVENKLLAELNLDADK